MFGPRRARTPRSGVEGVYSGRAGSKAWPGRGGNTMILHCLHRRAAVWLGLVAGLGLVAIAAWADEPKPKADEAGPKADAPADPYVSARNRMVERHLMERGIMNPRVLE